MSAIDALAPEPIPARPANAASVAKPARTDAGKPTAETKPADDDSFSNMLDAETKPAAAEGPSDDANPTANTDTQAPAKAGGKAGKPGKGIHAQLIKVAMTPEAASAVEGASAAPTATPTPPTTNLALALGIGASPKAVAADGSEPAAEMPVVGETAANAAASLVAAALNGATPVPVASAAPAMTAAAKPLAAVTAPTTPAVKADASATPAAIDPASFVDAAPASSQVATPDAAQPAAAASSPAHGAPHAAAASASADAKPAAIDATVAAPTPKADAAAAPLAAPQTTTTTPVAAATAVSAAATPAALRAAPEAAVQVYHRIIERNDGRSQRFEMRLDPMELGRVDIRIEVNADKKVHAVLAAHDSAALADLVKGQKGLEQALKDSGLDLADGGLKFELSADTGRSFAGSENRSQTHYEPGFFGAKRADLITLPTTQEVAAAARPSWAPQRLNLVA